MSPKRARGRCHASSQGPARAARLIMRIGRAVLKNPLQRQRQACHISLDGMPEVRLLKPPVASCEHIPWLWIYVPVVVKWFLLALRYRSLTLPTAANPYIESGGFRGESKASYLRQITTRHQRWVANWTAFRILKGQLPSDQVQRVEAKMTETGIAYPVVVKPDIGTCGYGVRLVHCSGELATYLAGFPVGQLLMLQEFVPWAGEAGVFYVRMPGEERGQIYSLGLRYYPHVVGDGHSTLHHLIMADPRASRRAEMHLAAVKPRLDEVPERGAVIRLALVANLRVGALYRDGSDYITAALAERFDGIARSMPEFHYGRFDVRFRTTEGLKDGEDLLIIEVNGAGAEATHIWDPELTIGDAYRVLFEQHEILFAIAARNRARGFPPLGMREIIKLQWMESKLLRAYPVSN